MLKLREYQETISTNASILLQEHWVVMIAMQVRTWKTFTALETIRKFWSKNVLFLTKKKAISSIEDDYAHYQDFFDMTTINYESIHKVEWIFDIIVLDESHTLWTFPKPSNKTKIVKRLYGKLPMVLLSWTPSPESYSQLFHQFHIKQSNIWAKYTNFYSWCRAGYVKIKQIRTSYGFSNCYKSASYDMIMADVGHLILTYTQQEAWFTTKVNETILRVPMRDITYRLVKRLKTDKVIESWDKVILADTMVKEKQKIHQLYSWTIKFENWETMVLDKSKGLFIKERFKDQKIAIFYIFKAEKELLKTVFGDKITDNLDEFNSTDKNIMLQVVSGREWISLKAADSLVFFNIAFSALSYWQARDRLSTMDRLENDVYWIFSEWWLEWDIYEAVQNKKDFTTKMYRKNVNK